MKGDTGNQKESDKGRGCAGVHRTFLWKARKTNQPRCAYSPPTLVLGVSSVLSLPTLSEFYQLHYKNLDHRAFHQMLLKVNHFCLSNASCNLESSGRV